MLPGLYSGQSLIRQKNGKQRYRRLKRLSSVHWHVFERIAASLGDLENFYIPAIGGQPHQVLGTGRCDRDKFNGNLEDLKKTLGV
jgi:hypothetical protein